MFENWWRQTSKEPSQVLSTYRSEYKKELKYFLNSTDNKFSWIDFLKFLEKQGLSQSQQKDNALQKIVKIHFRGRKLITKYQTNYPGAKQRSENKSKQAIKQRNNVTKYWAQRKENVIDIEQSPTSVNEGFEINLNTIAITLQEFVEKARKGHKFIHGRLYARRILFMTAMEFEFLSPKLVAQEKKVGIPSREQFPLRIQMNYMSCEKTLLNNFLLNSITLNILKNIRSWGLISYGDRDAHQGLHCDLYTMRQSDAGVFLWTLVDTASLPLPNMSKKILSFSSIVETMLLMAVSNTLNQTIGGGSVISSANSITEEELERTYNRDGDDSSILHGASFCRQPWLAMSVSVHLISKDVFMDRGKSDLSRTRRFTCSIIYCLVHEFVAYINSFNTLQIFGPIEVVRARALLYVHPITLPLFLGSERVSVPDTSPLFRKICDRSPRSKW
ncbi:12462_t:CDS:2 [Ambispora gerdemannii]|uniref:12462_t:CDS:1 n=1 Tax=Ambispora gerdemannii TaxID=144530 RepID=A0A9N8Z674_9GLOM|nr:12462_t:CDS:2 [Ambispora gerdemannii]